MQGTSTPAPDPFDETIGGVRHGKAVSRRGSPRLSEAEQRRRIERFVRWMDTGFRVPGTSVRFGMDSVIGLVPVAGDLITAVASGWLIREAVRAGAPPGTLAKMVGNVAIDFAIGWLPIVGDLGDVFWKANLRNARLLERHFSLRAARGESR